MPTQTRAQRREAEQRKIARDKYIGIAFAILLQVVGEIPSVPLIPWGCFLIVSSLLLFMLLFWNSETVERLPVKEKLFGLWCILLLAVVTCSVIGLPDKWKAEKAAETEGDLTAPNDGNVYSDDDVRVQVGARADGTVLLFPWSGSKDLFTIAGSKLTIRGRVEGSL